MRRLPPALLAAALVLGACSDDPDDGTADAASATTTTTANDGAAPPTTPTSLPADDALGGFTPEPLAWSGCGGDLECATLAVPLDWNDVGGPTIDLAVTRIPARGDDPIGAIATNPGGPGASGNTFIGGGVFSDDLTERFDTLSWDPRGVGGSAPLHCDQAAIDEFVRLDTEPDTPAEAAALDEGATAVAQSCEAGSGDLLPHVGTASVARDLEAIRRAYGRPMAYVGFSYGTSIGLQHLRLFPGTMLGVVLDGVVDPTDTQTDLLRGQAAAFESILDEVLQSAGAADDYDRLAAQLEQAPLDADGEDVGPGDLATAALYALYDESLHRSLVRALDAAEEGDGGPILDLADAYRSVAGFGLYQAVSCTDSVNPTGSAAWTAFAEELAALAPRTGAAVANEMRPCAFWPVPPDPVVGPVAAEGSGPVLVIGTTGDPATPVAQAEAVAEMLADGHLVVFDGAGHTAYFSSACVQEIVAGYLLDGEVPADGTRC